MEFFLKISGSNLKKKTTRLARIHNHIFYAAQFYKYLILVLSILGMLYLVF